MDKLTLEQADQIILDIRRQEISFSHLFDELVDHICCDVDREMQGGLSFAEAYQKVRDKIGARGLKKIQEDTLYAVDTKYRNMKNTMKISGVAGTVLLGFAALFKIQHWAGAGILMTLGAVSLAFIFLPSALVVLWKETRSRKRLFLFVSGFLAGMIFIVGMLFKIQHWPAAGVLISLSFGIGLLLFLPSLLVSKLTDPEKRNKRLVYVIGFAGVLLFLVSFWMKIMHWPLAGAFMTFGSILLFIVAFPWYSWISWKNERHVSKEFIFMMLASLFFVLPAALIQLNLQRNYEEGFFVQLEQQQSLVDLKEKNIVATLDLFRDSACYESMEQVHTRTANLLEKIRLMQTRLTDLGLSAGSLPDGRMDPDYRKLSAPFTTMAVSLVLLPSCPPRQELEMALKEYRDALISLAGEEWDRSYAPLLNSGVYLPPDTPSDNELVLINGLHAVTLLKNAVLTAESGALWILAKSR